MGLGPSIKMTTLHHYNCPLTRALSKEKELDFAGILVDGVSEGCDEKIYTAKRTADLARLMGVDGAIVAIDGWGNHHVDFVSVIGELGRRGIPSVGLSYVGLQGRLVCTNEYVDLVLDFNKNASGYESCIVGDNNLDEMDARKAVALIKSRLRKKGLDFSGGAELPEKKGPRLIRRSRRVECVEFADRTGFAGDTLYIRRNLAEEVQKTEPRLKSLALNLITPDDHGLFVNSNLDFAPIACKLEGEPGEGTTLLLSNVVLMINGVEEGGFQPCNIGSSEGILRERVDFDRDGTPKSTDLILQADVVFQEGEGRTAGGVRAAHRAADRMIQEIRQAMREDARHFQERTEEFCDVRRPGKPSVALVKITSGLGNMYETFLFPDEPGGMLGGHSMMESRNLPYAITPNQCRDGVIHTLL